MKPPVYDVGWCDEVKRVYAHDMEEMWDKRIAPHVYNTYQSQLALYESLVPSSPCKILDVGCAQATLAIRLAEAGHQVTAVDLRQHFLDYAKRRWTHGSIEFLCGNALEIDYSGAFDVIFVNQLVEHMVYPHTLLSRLVRHLVPGGRLIVTTPNARYFRCRLPTYTELGDPGAYEHLQFTADGDGHFFAYTADELSKNLAEAGLQRVRVSTFETPWLCGHLKIRHLHRFVSYRLLTLLDTVTRRMPGSDRMASQLLAIGTR